jgi:cytochrome P450 family 110
MALPPGPRWPALLQTIALLRSGQTFLERAAQRYGDLFTIRTLVFGAQVITSDPELIKQIFTGDPEVYHAGEANSAGKRVMGDRSVLLLDDAPHRRARRLLMPAFHGERMAAHAETMRAVTERIVSSWRAGERFQLRPYLQRITRGVIVENVFGFPEGPRRDLFEAKLEAMVDRAASPLGAFFFVIPPLQRDLGPLYPWRWIKAQLDEIDGLIFGQIAERRAQLVEAGRGRSDDILSLLLEVRDEGGEGMSDLELRDQLFTLVVAGQDTTASSLAWAFERILAHPEVHARIVAEIDGMIAQGKTAAVALAELPYLDATVKETMRQRPSVAQAARHLTRPVVLRGHEIPAGAMVSPSMFLTHRRPDLYPDPERFQPERFLGKKTDPYTYFPFGGGQRRCLGAAFSLQEMKIVVGIVLHRWRLQLVKTPPLRPDSRSIFFTPEGGTEVVVLGERSEFHRPA